MVSQVGFNTGFNNLYNYNTMAIGNNSSLNTNPIFSNIQNTNNGLSPTIGNDYSDDIMMQKFDIMLNSALNNQPQQSIQGQNQQSTQSLAQNKTQEQNQNLNNSTAFTSNPNNQINTNELNGYLAQQDKNIAYTENNNPYYKSNTGKKAGLFLGFLAPAAGKIVKLFQGAKFKDLFKFKQLAIACPALAAVGFGVGALIDGYINTNRAKAADQISTQQVQNTQQYIA